MLHYLKYSYQHSYGITEGMFGTVNPIGTQTLSF